MTLLLLFRRGYGDWPERPAAAAEPPATLQQDRFLIAPKVEDVRRPATRPVKKTGLR